MLRDPCCWAQRLPCLPPSSASCWTCGSAHVAWRGSAGSALRWAAQQQCRRPPAQQQLASVQGLSPRASERAIERSSPTPARWGGGGTLTLVLPSPAGSSGSGHRRKAAHDSGGAAARHVRPRHAGAWSPNARCAAAAAAPAAAAPAAAAPGAPAAGGQGMRQGGPCAAADAPAQAGRTLPPQQAARQAAGARLGAGLELGGAGTEQRVATPPCRPGPGLGHGLACGAPGARPLSAEAANAVSPPHSHPVPLADSPPRDAPGAAEPGRAPGGAPPGMCGGGAPSGDEHGAADRKCLEARAAAAPSLHAPPSAAARAGAAHRAHALTRLAAGRRPAKAPGAAAAALREDAASAGPAGQPAEAAAPPASVWGPGNAAARAAARSQRAAAAPAGPGEPAGPDPDATRLPGDATGAGGAGARAAGQPPEQAARAGPERGRSPDAQPHAPDPAPLSAVKRGLSRLLGMSPLRLGLRRGSPDAGEAASRWGGARGGATPGVAPGGRRRSPGRARWIAAGAAGTARSRPCWLAGKRAARGLGP